MWKRKRCKYAQDFIVNQSVYQRKHKNEKPITVPNCLLVYCCFTAYLHVDTCSGPMAGRTIKTN